MTPLIDATEMYLRTVWELEEEGIPPIRARLVDRLGLSAPAVSETVHRLVEEGLLHLDDGRLLALTERGREIAVDVMRKHRLAERLLTDVIGLPWEQAHNEACRWEHVISDAVDDRLVEVLGDPQTSPFGNPIPSGDPVRPWSDLQTVAEVAAARARRHDRAHLRAAAGARGRDAAPRAMPGSGRACVRGSTSTAAAWSPWSTTATCTSTPRRRRTST